MFGWSSAILAKTVITVGTYYFPPIAEIGENNEPVCFLGDLIHQIEATNPDLEFRFVHTSPKRRYLDFEAGLYDVIFFESASWNWIDRDVTISPPLIADEEVYVALMKPGRDQSFFDDISSRHIVALAGYHYRFSGFETDTQVLQKNFNIEFSADHDRSLQLIMADRPSVADVAIINRAYLQAYFAEYPEDRGKFLISDKPDSQYVLQIIARKDGPLSADNIYHMLTPVIKNGTYRSLVKKWGLKLPPSLEAIR